MTRHHPGSPQSCTSPEVAQHLSIRPQFVPTSEATRQGATLEAHVLRGHGGGKAERPGLDALSQEGRNTQGLFRRCGAFLSGFPNDVGSNRRQRHQKNRD